jgi:multicomponent Na+:H+ antiporter subunit B
MAEPAKPGKAPARRPGELSFAGRRALFLIGALGLGALMIWGLAGLPDFRHATPLYGQVINHVAVEERSATDAVTAVNFDYRAFDTLGEEFILFAAALVLVLLLRRLREERSGPLAERPRRVHTTSAAVRMATVGLVGPTVLLAIYITAHGHLTPGGGFQGGVIAATALLLVYLGSDYAAMKRVGPMSLIETAKSAGAAGFVLIGFAGLLAAGAFLENFLPLGDPGELVSSGTIPLLSLAVGLEVSGGFALLLSQFLDQLLVIRRKQGSGA